MLEHGAEHGAPSPAPIEPEPAQTISSNNGFRPTMLLKDNALPVTFLLSSLSLLTPVIPRTSYANYSILTLQTF